MTDRIADKLGEVAVRAQLERQENGCPRPCERCGKRGTVLDGLASREQYSRPGPLYVTCPACDGTGLADTEAQGL